MNGKSNSFKNITTVVLGFLLLGIVTAHASATVSLGSAPALTDSKFGSKQIDSHLKIRTQFIFS